MRQMQLHQSSAQLRLRQAHEVWLGKDAALHAERLCPDRRGMAWAWC